MNLSQEEVDSFLSNVLHMSDVRSWFATDKRSLLDDVTKRFSYNMTFHDLDLLSTPAEERKVPSLEDNKRLALSGQGGLCWTLNGCLMAVLDNIGYTVYPVASSVGMIDPEKKVHFVIIVTNVVEKDDHYLVDVGFAYPTFCAIPLDFEDHSPSYKQSWQEFRYIWENGLGVRQQRSIQSRKTDHDIFDFEVDGKGWTNAYYFSQEQRDISYFSTAVRLVYEKQEDLKTMTLFQKSVRVVGFPEGRCIAIKDSTLLQEGDDHVLHATELDTHEDIVNAVIIYFPQFQGQRPKVKAAVEEWAKMSEIISLL